MKVKLLKRLTAQSKDEIAIYSITKGDDGVIIGMRYGYDESCYRDVFEFGNTEEEVMQKVRHIYIQRNFDYIRSRYKKYTISNRKSKLK